MEQMRRAKITIVEAGNVGATFAHLTLMKKLDNVVLVDSTEGILQGKALDMQEAAPVESISGRIVGSNITKKLPVLT